MYEVLGIKHYSFRDQTGKTVEGTTIHCVYEDANIEGGKGVEKLSCRASVDVSGIRPGDIVEPFYDKYGKVRSLEVC